ncbi:uncharacterized protein MELLADRAFT_68574 [Melampsora larici-populina 98AG31]|uniref:Uncharacterized protein n=1 Tax=Melampsora larici-populina (strain 98AG31 / pathotype 3-4-7) TaxID=747676 RepID=F4S7A5_MELLP|nr:uncharacterized protein MELLADRAFT_68574 [Melampsora larici-populina 98AG31]EGF99510.1 hypothetical protein MELLADRAFT_68574 [Melampsora larici-populina 98AG31]
MVFTDSKTKLHTRVRSAVHKLRPSKSSISLSTSYKAQNSESFLVPPMPPPMPLPVLTLPASISHRLAASTLFDGVISGLSGCNEAGSISGSEASQSIDEVSKIADLPALNKRLEREGLLDSPIIFGPATLEARGSASDVPSPEASSSLKPSDVDKLTLDILRYHNLGPCTPELGGIPAAETSECKTIITTPESNKYLPKGPPEVDELITPTSSTKTSSSKPSPVKTNEIWVTLENPHYSSIKVNISPPRHFLRRKGPIPTSRALSLGILQSLIPAPIAEMSTSPRRRINGDTTSEAEPTRHLFSRGRPVAVDTELELKLVQTTKPLRIARWK